ncbi:anaphase promoting complex subunit 5 [Cavenderia fasciculata]|uniref:Anaphase-promoting complex subunit 5 n=1 Tax=Cavenderia fasciculata TaxID=261658 RepID=F4PRV6_CACFS|nr:anaphase promoting complex subunit 5 [Cavenderia fasciculata]EGG21392.1 anaphase promoting complex subunit 5 [Cavenderia fasciculata]|eukprot:XP_004359242.1 anaphase promoting complex subunit 5 [Cavenderia fasciculata]
MMMMMDNIQPVNRITPHKLCLCSLIEYYLYSDTITFHQRRSLSLVLIKHIKRSSNYSDPTLREFIETDLKQRLSDHFINNEFIEKITFKSIDDVHQFITDLNQLFVKEEEEEEDSDDEEPNNNHQKYLEPNSILGSFVQKIILNYNQTMFDGLADVYHETRSYIQEYNRDEEDIDYDNRDISLSSTHGILTKSTFLSPFDEERFICEEIIRVNHLIGKENPIIIKQRIEELRRLLPDANKSIYLGFLNCLYHMEFDGALEELHRYFDYCNSGSRGVGGGDNLNTLLPYAVLNLSKLHFQFGHYEEAYMSLQETIRIAQERSDHSCLALALNLLNKLLEPSVLQTIDNSDLLQSLLDSQSQLEVLQSSTKKSEQLEMTSLSSLNYMSQSKFNLINNQNNQQQNINNYNNNNNNQTTTTTISESTFFNNIFYPLQKSHQMSRDGSKTLNQMKSTVWEILGNYDLAQYYAELSLCFDNTGQLANLVVSTRSNNNNNNNQTNTTTDTMDDILSYTKMALLSSKRGHYQEAVQALNNCIAKFPFHSHIQSSPLSFVLVSVIFDHARMSRNYTICQRSIETLLSLLNKRAPQDNNAGGWDEILQTSERIAEYYIDMDMPDSAHSFLGAIIKTATLYGQDQYLPSLYILKATLYSNTKQSTLTMNHCNSSSDSNSDWLTSGAISNTLNSLSLTEPSSHHHHVNPTLTCKANLLLVNIYIQSTDFSKAIQLLSVTIPLVLKDLNLLTQSYLLFSKSLLSLFLQQQQQSKGNNNNSSSNQKEREKIQYYMDVTEKNAITLTNHKILEQVYYLQSIYYNRIGDIEKRDHYAKQFKSLSLLPLSSSSSSSSSTLTLPICNNTTISTSQNNDE